MPVRPSRQRVVRSDSAIAAALVVGLAVVCLGLLFHVDPKTFLVSAGLLTASVLTWIPSTRSWAARGVVTWALTIDAGLLYLVYVADWTLRQHPGTASLMAGTVLWLLELAVFVLALGYVWELVDVLARVRWARAADLHHVRPGAPEPFVTIHVPTHNEPPDLVIETLEHLLRLDYTAYQILLVDNNTDDPSLWRPVEEFCSHHERVRFFHLDNWPGYKSGALNFALEHSDSRAELVAIVDADYHVGSDFLRECTPYFADARTAFVQTPQDYRDWETSSYFRRLYHSYGYFFAVSQRSRNERDGAIFGGTMGLIRRSALQDVGGWDEWCITEDAELSLRLLRAGWSGRHVARSYGQGVMPLTFEALKRQRYRWCFGGVQILRMHVRSLMPWNRSPDNRLSLAQRWAYLIGGLQWFGDLIGSAFTLFLLLGAVDLAFGDGVVVRRLNGFLLLSVVVLLVLGSLRSLALIRRVSHASWREAIGAFGIWVALGWTVTLAATRGLFAREGSFLRTPKTKGQLSWRDSVAGCRAEIAIVVLCLVGAALAALQATVGAGLVAALLGVQALSHVAAPANSWAALHADLPAQLRRRRRDRLTGWALAAPLRRRLLWVPAAAAGVGAAAAAFAVLMAPVQGPGAADITHDAGARTGRLPSHDRAVAPVPSSGTPSPSRQPSPNPTQSTQTTALVADVTNPATQVLQTATSTVSGTARTTARLTTGATPGSTRRPTSTPSTTAPSTAPTKPGRPTAVPTTKAPVTGPPTTPKPSRRTTPTHPVHS